MVPFTRVPFSVRIFDPQTFESDRSMKVVMELAYFGSTERVITCATVGLLQLGLTEGISIDSRIPAMVLGRSAFWFG